MRDAELYDLIVIGGGINGTGIAFDAASRGLKVFLCEQYDLASGTSSMSSKLIHGGLRYLEQYQFRLVKEALAERTTLQTTAKHLVRPLNFILPHTKLRSRHLIKLGLMIYDHLARHSSLPRSHTLQLKNHSAQNYLKPAFKLAFQYSDCQVDDARLVIANALAARDQGACIATYTQCIQARRTDDYWSVELKNNFTEQIEKKRGRVLINATGPWVDNFLKQQVSLKSNYEMTLVKGSHIVVPKLYDDDFAFILQNDDQRVIFVIPYLNDFHLIGTTDVLTTAAESHIDDSEINYLIKVANNYLLKSITKDDIIHSYSGVRPLLKSAARNPAQITRDYAIDLDISNSIISLFGGKLTTYRKLAEKVTDLLAAFFKNLGPSRTHHLILPGSDFQNECDYLSTIGKKYLWAPAELLQRYFNQYGTQLQQLLNDSSSLANLGHHFGAGLYQREVDYLIGNEWVKTAPDLLWRRTKLGYFMTSAEQLQLQTYLSNKLQSKY